MLGCCLSLHPHLSKCCRTFQRSARRRRWGRRRPSSLEEGSDAAVVAVAGRASAGAPAAAVVALPGGGDDGLVGVADETGVVRCLTFCLGISLRWGVRINLYLLHVLQLPLLLLLLLPLLDGWLSLCGKERRGNPLEILFLEHSE